MQLSNGTVINGRYTVKSCIGQGGFGITYLAHDERLMQDVVLKEYFPDFMVKRNTENAVETMTAGDIETYEKGKTRFLNEARLLASLRDLSEIVTIFDYFLENNTAYIVMEYINGNSLKDIIRSRSVPYTFDEAMKIIMPCIDALQKVHEHGLIHRDFTPDNILMTKKGDVRIIDFGASKDYVASEKTMTVMVKHGYAPLEQYSQDGRQGTWTDVYSACAIIFEMLTLKKPQAAIDRTMSDDVSIASIKNDSLSDSKKQVILKGLSLKSKERYQTLEELIAELKRPDSISDVRTQSPQGGYTGYQSNQNTGYTPYYGNTAYNTNRTGNGVNNTFSGQSNTSNGQSYTTSGQSYTSTQYNRSQQITRSEQYTNTTEKKKNSSVAPILIGIIAGVAVLAAVVIGVIAMSGKSNSSEKNKGTKASSEVGDEFSTENKLDSNDDEIETEDSSSLGSSDTDDYEKPSDEDVANHDTTVGNWDITKERRVTIDDLNITVPVPAGYYYIDRTIGMDDTFVNYHFDGQQDKYDSFMENMKGYGVYIALYPEDESRDVSFYIRADSAYSGDPNYNEFKDYSSSEWKEYYKTLNEEAQDGGYGTINEAFNYRDINNNVIVGFKSSDEENGTESVKVSIANGSMKIWAECDIDDSSKTDHMVTRLVNIIQKIGY